MNDTLRILTLSWTVIPHLLFLHPPKRLCYYVNTTDRLFVCLLAKWHRNSGGTAKPFLGQWRNIIPTNEPEQAVDIFLEMINSDYLITWCGWLSNRFRSLHNCRKSTGLTSKTYDRLDFSLVSRPIESIVKRWTRSVDSIDFGVYFNDLEPPQTKISRSSHCLMLNISVMAKDTVIVTMEGE